jgi:hypothetical protein
MIPIHLVKTLSTGDLEGSADYLDKDGNVIHSFVQSLYKYQGGFYSFNQITTRTYPQIGWWILLTILIAAVFVIIIYFYWPMLFTIYSEINELPVQFHREFMKFHNGIKEMFSGVLDKTKYNLVGRVEIGKIQEEKAFPVRMLGDYLCIGFPSSSTVCVDCRINYYSKLYDQRIKIID